MISSISERVLFAVLTQAKVASLPYSATVRCRHRGKSSKFDTSENPNNPLV